jgi:hypothetical protein
VTSSLVTLLLSWNIATSIAKERDILLLIAENPLQNLLAMSS